MQIEESVLIHERLDEHCTLSMFWAVFEVMNNKNILEPQVLP